MWKIENPETNLYDDTTSTGFIPHAFYNFLAVQEEAAVYHSFQFITVLLMDTVEILCRSHCEALDIFAKDRYHMYLRPGGVREGTVAISKLTSIALFQLLASRPLHQNRVHLRSIRFQLPYLSTCRNSRFTPDTLERCIDGLLAMPSIIR